MCIRDMYPIQYSKYVDECCQAIFSAAEYATDIDVVHLTRFHGIADRIARSLSPGTWHMTPALGSAPLGACVKSLESELQQQKTSWSAGNRQNGELTQVVCVVGLTRKLFCTCITSLSKYYSTRQRYMMTLIPQYTACTPFLGCTHYMPASTPQSFALRQHTPFHLRNGSTFLGACGPY